MTNLRITSVFRRSYQPYLYLLPSVIFLILFTYWPVVYSLGLSLFRQSVISPVPVFAGFGNYRDAFQADIFWTVVKNTLVFVVGTIPVTMVIALMMAVLLNENLGWLRNVYRVALFYPTMIPMAAAAMLGVWLFNPGIGLINYYLARLGVPARQWLYSMDWALPAIMITAIWKNFGYFMIIFLAGLQSISNELYESADMEGAGFFQKLWFITLPLLGPTSMFVVVVGIITSFQVFDLVYVMTQGGPADRTNVMVYYIYQYAFRFWNIGRAAALTVLFLVALIGFIVILVRSMERKVHYEV
ncbi:ABC transporter permease [Alkalispirochaeta sphaeroplastigenens]|uniref:ABC transporter permease n=1 Tax=Alkalispirochaeta sphaeroplastigenens TaxID=1187066 RepID=A0A2S4JH31_9SPIO|nr:sugar ABC transporter permease [Alkalispirochaeta sphaeroplastigenens]POQ98785.1 ABC transporter permease [Alkalispirochaeta sphaeroplastigenens]